MARKRRESKGGLVYHVMNRAAGKARIFRDRSDYGAFLVLLREAAVKVPMRIICYCLMPNHWHLVLWPVQDRILSSFVGWLTQTHAQRWRRNRDSVGAGHLYQGRFKSFPVQSDEHYYAIRRYVERNALRANLVDRAEDWRWGSLWAQVFGSPYARSLLTDGPMRMPANWATQVNRPQTEAEIEALRVAIRRGRPYGSEEWAIGIARELGIESTMRPRGRPKKGSDPFSEHACS